MSEKQNALLNGPDGKQQVELFIKKEQKQPEVENTIDLAEVLKFMASKKKIYALVLAICFIVGAIVPLIMYQVTKTQPNAVALVTFAYEAAYSGQAPDGSALNVNEIKSSYVLTNALKTVNLSAGIEISDLANNISIQGVLTDETKRQLELLAELDPTDANYYKAASEIQLVYGNRYIVTLANSFGKAKTILPNNELRILLEAITSAYDEYFFDTYSMSRLPANTLSTVSFDNLDYLDYVSQISSALSDLSEYCAAKQASYPDFRSASDGFSFGDLKEMVDTKISVSADPLYSVVLFSHYTKELSTLVTTYEYKIHDAELKLNTAEEQIASIKQAIEKYKNEQLVIMSTEDQTAQSSQLTTDYYNNLLLSLMGQYAEAASLTQLINQYNDIIRWYEESNPKTADNNTLTNITKLYNESVTLYNLISSHSAELFETDYYRNSRVSALVTMEEGKSLMDNVKNILIGAIAGLFVGFVIWVCDAVVMEIKKSGKERHPAEEE